MTILINLERITEIIHHTSFFFFAMASTILLLISFLLIIISPLHAFIDVRDEVCIKSIYSLGDSIADTGNLIREGAEGPFAAVANFPYGMTSFDKPTGRCSDGLLMIDYLAKALNLPLIAPNLDKEGDFTHGANFAVAGATASDSSFFEKKGISMPFTNSSLNVQLQRFKSHLKSRCTSPSECAKKLKQSLVLVGEIGGNDYNYAFLAGKSIEELASYVPSVVQTIADAIKEVIEMGATNIVVPGNFPIGCMPVYLTAINSNNQSDFDTNKCLKGLNAFAMLHNNQLQQALENLRRSYPRTMIIYADYYHAFLHMIESASSFGFDQNTLTKSCCGSGGKYNFDITKPCGASGVSVCKNPTNHISWDGVHLTEAAYKVMATHLIRTFHYPRYIFENLWKCL